MLKAILRHIYKKPKVVRSQYALFIAAGVTGLTVLVWLPTSFIGHSTDATLGVASIGDSVVFSGFSSQARDQFNQMVKGEEVVTAVTQKSDPRQLLLSPEDIELAQAKLLETTATDASSTVEAVFRGEEIQIITTSQAASLATTSQSSQPR